MEHKTIFRLPINNIGGDVHFLLIMATNGLATSCTLHVKMLFRLGCLSYSLSTAKFVN